MEVSPPQFVLPLKQCRVIFVFALFVKQIACDCKAPLFVSAIMVIVLDFGGAKKIFWLPRRGKETPRVAESQ